jgi:uncharacterized protein YbjT (DUF2867 family)
MIVVTGATGTVGSEVVGLLLEAGEKVRAMTRDPSKARLDPRVEVAKGDTGDPESLARVIEGASAVFAVTFGPEGATHDGNIARAAKANGARVVKLGAMGADSGRSTIGGWHHRGEEAIKEVGVAWTALRPGGFMSNARNWAPSIKATGKFFLPYGDGGSAPIHPRDIAACAVAALTSSKHDGKAYDLSGPEVLTMHEQAKILSDATGKTITYVPVSDEAAREGMLKAGMPAMLVDALMEFAPVVRRGDAAHALPTVREITGRPGLTFAEWARDNAGVFR